jgi:oligopeptide/dipeptide ABC transporter ATP-binding protein
LSDKKILEVKNLKVFYESSGSFFTNKNIVKAVNGIDININQGETFGLVGESGSGKSTVAKAILNLVNINSGEIKLEKENLTELKGSKLRSKQKEIGAIFQDPYSSLNPRMKVRDIIAEPLRVQGKKDVEEDVKNLLQIVGLDSRMDDRLPHEFSGGQRQRIGIARAVSTNPKLIICDEPVSALDVSVQAQILNLLKDLQKKLNISYLFIAHDLSVVKYLSLKIGVMYLGKIVEMADSEVIFSNPMHPYTKILISSIPAPDPKIERKKKFSPIKGDIPSAANPPSGCVFRTRCPNPTEECRDGKSEMGLIEKEPGHWVDKCCINCN